jgi:hypothetical protein
MELGGKVGNFSRIVLHTRRHFSCYGMDSPGGAVELSWVNYPAGSSRHLLESKGSVMANPVSDHYANYLRYVDSIHAKNAGIFTASQQHTVPAYAPWAMYPKVEAK